MRGCFTDEDGLVSQFYMERLQVDCGINRYGFYIQLLTCTNNPTGDLASIGNQYLGKHNLPFISRNGSPFCASDFGLRSKNELQTLLIP